MGIVFDRSHLAGQFGGADDMDSRHAIVLRRERMNQPRFDTRLAESSLDRPVVGSRHLDRDDRIADAVLLARLFALDGGQLHLRPGMLDFRRRHEHLSKEVTQHPLRPGLGTVNGDDSKPLRSYLFHPRLDDSVGFAKSGWTVCAGFARIVLSSHSNCLLFGEKGFLLFPQRTVGMVLLISC